MSVFSVMQVYCPICRVEMDGMRAYGREAHCCSKQCADEWVWRQSLAVIGRAYSPRPKVLDSHVPMESNP